MLRAIYVRLNRLVDGRIEVHNTSEVDDNIDLALENLKVLRRNSTQGFIKIAFDNLHLSPHDTFTTDAVDDHFERRRLQHFRVETLFTRQILLSAGLHDQMFQFRETIEHHRKEDFSNEPGAAEKQHCLVAESLDRRDFTGSTERLRFAWLVFAKHGIPSPRRECTHQKAFAAFAG